MMAVKTSKIDLSRKLRNLPLVGLKLYGAGGGAQPPAISVLTLDNNTLPENSPEDTLVGTFTVEPDVSILTLFDDAGGRLKIVGKALLAGAVPSDFEATPVLDPIVRASYGTQYLDKPFTILVTDVVELTGFSFSQSPGTMPEGSAPGTVAGAFTSTPSGATYTLVDDAGGQFALVGNQLVAGATPTDYETNTSIDVTVTASLGGESVTQVVTVNLSNVNEGGDITLSNATLSENSAPNSAVGTLSSTLTSPTYTIQSQTPAGDYFRIISGNILAASATFTDFEVNATHSVTIRATSGSDFVDKAFTITITDVDEISDITLSAATIPENSAAGTIVGTLVSTPINNTTYSIVSQTPAGNYFAITGGTSLAAGATPTNFEANTTHSVTVRGTRFSETFDKTFTITVTDVDEINDITLSANTVAEGTAAAQVVGALTSTPAGAAFSIVSQTPAGTYFAISGTNLVTGATATNYEANQSHSVTIRGTRLGETYDEVFTINVTNVQEITDIALSGSTIAENTTSGVTVGALTSTPPGATFTILSQTPNNAFFAISGNNLVTGTSPTNYEANSSHSVTIQAALGADVYSEVFTITIQDVDEISAVSLSANSIAENSAGGTVVGNLTSTPPGATFGVQSQTPSGTYFVVNGSNQLVAGATPTDFETNQTHSVTVRGTIGSETFDQVFTINVTNVQEVTDITLSNASVNEATAAGQTVGTLASVIAGATFSITSQTPSGTYFAISGNNLVTGATPTDFETNTSHSVTILATRGADTYSETFTITVNDVDEISAIALSAATIPENSTAGTVVGGLTSTPGGAAFTLAPSNTAGTLFAISGTNLVAGATATNYEAATSHVVTVRGTRGNEVFDQAFTITVTDVDEISAIALSANSVNENTGAGVTVGTLSSTPVGAVFTIVSQTPNNTFFAISGNNLVTGATPTDYETNTSHSVTVRGTRLGETFDQVFTINVINADEITTISLSPSTINEVGVGGSTTQSIGTLSSTPPGAAFSIPTNWQFGFNITGGTTLNKNGVANPFPYMPDFPEYDAGRGKMPIIATLGSDVHQQDVLITIAKAATDVLTLTSAQSQDVIVAAPSTSLSISGATGGSVGAPYSYGWFTWGDAGDKFDLTNTSGNPCTVTLKTGLTGTYSGYLIAIATNGNNEFGNRWIKVTLTR